MALLDSGSGTANVADVDANSNLRVNLPGYSAAGVIQNGGPAAGPGIFSENDPGTKTGARYMSSPETDDDYRLRIAMDHILDRETFNYTAQNTGKHAHAFTTVTATVSANGLLTNSGSGVATATGMTFGTFGEFPVGMGSASTYCETNMALNVATASIPSNAVIDVGMFRRGASTAFAPLDGAFFRFTSAGVQGVVNNNTVETASSPFAPGFLANENHLYTISITEKDTEFWIDNVLYCTTPTPLANGQPFRSATLPWSVRHANTGAVGSVLQASITDYTISHGGPMYATSLAQVGNRSLGSYQGLSGGVMGSLTGGTITSGTLVSPTAAVPTNTTAALGTGLGGQFWETATLALNTDGIVMSYQNPAGTIAVQGRRMVINGISMAAYIQTVIAGGPFNSIFTLAFGHTAVSLATAESASFATGTTKAPRRIVLPEFTQLVTAAQAVSTMVVQSGPTVKFTNPIYVNSGEFVALTVRHVGTVGTSGVIAYNVSLDYGWE